MKPIKSVMLVAATMLLAPIANADRVIEAWTCDLK